MLKAEIRKSYKEKRSGLTDIEINENSLSICMQLFENVDFQLKKVSVFLPIERFQEINTWEIIERVSATYVLPVIKDEQLIHMVYESREQIKVSDWGIPEPTYGKEVTPKELDVVLVPLLAFDLRGNRVGYGKGFYDGFLSQCSPTCKFIGLSHFEAIDQIEDVFEGDIPLHFCVTPNKFYSF